MIEPQEVLLYGLAVRCPGCGEVLDIPVIAELSGNWINPTLEFTPDLADVWVHHWAHVVDAL